MPRRSKGPRLWLREAQYDRTGRLTHTATWLIKDGDHTARARDAALMIVEGLRQRSRDTSTKSNSRKRQRASARRLPSPSQMS